MVFEACRSWGGAGEGAKPRGGGAEAVLGGLGGAGGGTGRGRDAGAEWGRGQTGTGNEWGGCLSGQ